MNVTSDSSARCLSQIHSQVDAVRLIGCPNRSFGALGQVHQFVGCFFGDGAKLSCVFVGNNHQMAGTVRMDIENYKIEATTVQHEVPLVIARVCLDFAKDAA